MSDKYQILNPNKVKDNLGVTGKKSSQKKTEKNRQKEEKTPKKGDWCPCSQRDRAPVKRMVLPRRLRGAPVKIMEPSMHLGEHQSGNGALV
jgi:hypothetical protein